MSDDRGGNGGDYEVGYGKPPVHSRFQKGISGNPKGRKRKVTNGERLEGIINKKITITIDGRKEKLTVTETILMNCQRKALKGGLRDARTYFAMCKELGLEVVDKTEIGKMGRDRASRNIAAMQKLREEMWEDIRKYDKHYDLMEPYRPKQRAMILNDPHVVELQIAFWIDFLEKAANEVDFANRLEAFKVETRSEFVTPKLIKQVTRRYRERNGNALKYRD